MRQWRGLYYTEGIKHLNTIQREESEKEKNAIVTKVESKVVGSKVMSEEQAAEEEYVDHDKIFDLYYNKFQEFLVILHTQQVFNELFHSSL